MTTTPSAAVLRADDSRLQAMIRGDVAALDALLAEGCEYLHSSGTVHTKREYLDYVMSGRIRYLAARRQDVRVSFHGDFALVFGRLTLDAEVNGQARTLDVRFQSGWHNDGGWRMAAWASVTIPPAA